MKRIGTEEPLSGDERDRLVAELKYWQNRSDAFFSRREREEKAFLCLWRGQDANGLRMGTAEEEPWPFRGASDQRVRWGDTAFQEFLSLTLAALDRCKVEVTTDGSEAGARRAGAIQRLIGWCRRKMGAKWYEQIMALLRYMLVDTPAVAAMDVTWRVKRTRAVAVLERDALQAEYAAWRTAGDEDLAETEAAQAFTAALGAGAGAPERESVAAFLAAAKKVPPGDAEAVMDALAAEGACEAAVEADAWEGPEMKALRFGDDFVIPEATEDFEYADCLFRQQWIGEAELRELAETEGWSRAWVEETLRHKGANFYDTRRYANQEDFKNLVNLVWCYTAQTDAAGVTTRWVAVLSAAEGSAFGRRIVRSRRGAWEAVFFRREVLAGNLTASRGLAHLCAPDQGLAKSLKDMANDNAIVGSLPMVKAKGARVRNVMMEPFGVINMSQSDDVSFMQPPAYPAAAKEQVKALKDDLLAFLGLTNGETDVGTRTASFTAWMMAQFEGLYKRLVECAQDEASDAALAGVTGEGDVAGLRREDLDGDFQIALRFDPANMDHKDLIDRVTALGQILAPLDVRNEIDRGPVVRHAFAQLFPALADASLRSAEAVAGDDVRDEQANFVKIKAGLMPEIDTEGRWNYAARLEWHQRLREENPEAVAEMSARAQAVYAQYLRQLEMMYQQFVVNAETGKTGAEAPGSRG